MQDLNAWSTKSLACLNTCAPKLVLVFNTVLRARDCSINCGHRDEQEQNRLFRMGPGVTTKRWPNSKHNSNPSLGIDVCPYPPGDWTATDEQFREFGQFVLGVAFANGVPLIWGGDWKFPYDPAHYELRGDT